jgi:MSHA biogenesis protein MshL
MSLICRFSKGFSCLVVLFSALFLLSACDMFTNINKPDRAGNKEIQDYRDALSSRLPEPEDKAAEQLAGRIPPLQPYVAANNKKVDSMPLVSISVNQSVPLRDVLFELAQQAGYDLELDPRIRGSLIFTVNARPFDEVVERIAGMSNLRYHFNDQNVLRVELDTPYNQTYKIEYLSYIRSNKGSIRNDIAVVSGDGADTGSTFEATTESEADFWGELETNLTQILAASRKGLVTDSDPQITVAETNPNVQAVAPDGAEGVQPPDAVLQVQSLPVDDLSQTASDSGESSAYGMDKASFSVNRQAGLISVYASERAQKEVADYLILLRRATTSQVLIEAKILEVALNDQYATGIDWRAIDLMSGELALNYLTGAGDGVYAGTLNSLSSATATLPASGRLATSNNLVLGYAGNDVQALIEAVSGFGTVHALASPRLTVLNNQSAVLNVATNQVFFEIDIDVTTDNGATQTDIDSEIRNVPEGVLVNVQPSIDLDTKTISLALRPTITSVVSEVSDPAIQYITAANNISGVESLVPELNVQEIDSVIRVRSGQPIVMGGLLQDKVQVTQEGVPMLSEVPMFGTLFRQHQDSIQKTELIIFLKATILDTPGDSVHDTDRDIYRSFSDDRRPLRM